MPFVIVANSIGLLGNIIALYYDVRVIIGGDVSMSLVIGVARSSGLLWKCARRGLSMGDYAMVLRTLN